MTEEEKLILARVKDLYLLCKKHAKPKFSGFLNEVEQQLIKENAEHDPDFETVFSAGYADGERCMLGVFPEWESERAFPIVLLKITKGYDKALSHRDYLGSILSLGLERSKIGDILVSEEGAYAFVSEDVADYIMQGLKKISNCGVKIKKVSVKGEKLPQHEFKTVSAVAASDRADAICAAALGVSRRESALLIKAGKVCINHKEALSVSQAVKENDLISVRGYGRFILEQKGNFTGSGRIHVNFKKYK